MRVLLNSPLARPLLWYLCVALTAMACLPGEAVAALIPPGATSASRLEDLTKIQRVLELKLVRQGLADLGLTEEEISARLVRLDDAELHRFAREIDQAQVGGQVDCQGACALIHAAIFLGPYVVVLILIILGFLIAWLRDRPDP